MPATKPIPYIKVFEHEEYGQIVVQRVVDEEDRLSVRISIRAPSPLGECAVGLTSFKTERRQINAFEGLDEEKAVGVVEKVLWPTVQEVLSKLPPEDLEVDLDEEWDAGIDPGDDREWGDDDEN